LPLQVKRTVTKLSISGKFRPKSLAKIIPVIGTLNILETFDRPTIVKVLPFG
jgi:hypothetical protein